MGDPTHLPVTTLSANTEFSQTIELMHCYAHMLISPQKESEHLTVKYTIVSDHVLTCHIWYIINATWTALQSLLL